MDHTTKPSKRTVTKYDAQFYSDISQRKRGMPTPPTSTANGDTTHANKRQRLSSQGPSTPFSLVEDASVRNTPPASPPLQTMSLRVTIPQPAVTSGDRRTQAIRRAAAERWKPKLQQPFPKRREIVDAYTLKLMRHYAGSSTTPEPSFVRPMINTSPRVDKLRHRFPSLLTRSIRSDVTIAVSIAATAQTPNAICTQDRSNEELNKNKSITRSEYAQRLAWQSFSATEQDREDCGREALMESGLVVDELIKEHSGIKNCLPEWRQRYTSKFSSESRFV
ncbi:hypothetical protein ACEQ8H_001417 [Pleosporales sp. CAS-2024a]